MNKLNKEQGKKLEEIKKKFPIFRDFHSGLYGWERVNGWADLSSAKFETAQAAKVDRHKTLIHNV